MTTLTEQTVFGELLAPVARALEGVRGVDASTRVLSMADFIALALLRHLQGSASPRAQAQSLLTDRPI